MASDGPLAGGTVTDTAGTEGFSVVPVAHPDEARVRIETPDGATYTVSLYAAAALSRELAYAVTAWGPPRHEAVPLPP